MFKKVVGEDGLLSKNISKIHYYAYESNKELLTECKANLERLGMLADPTDECLFRGMAPDGSTELIFHLKPMDFAEDSIDEHIDVLIGCCFADLFDPDILAQALHRFLNTGQVRRDRSPTLLYFPITFAGTTCFYPASPFECPAIPSDTFSFRAYSASLTNRLGHNLDPLKIIDAIRGYGGELIEKGPSNWNIEASKHSYLWNTMLHFFQSSAVPELLGKWNASGWMNRSKTNRADIFVSNVDLLLRLDAGRITVVEEDNYQVRNEGNYEVDEIEFVSPRNVRKKAIALSIDGGDFNLGPNQIEVESVCSLISSGTELKIFNGLFDNAALDVNIKGMDDAEMAYPLAYGYSSVGKVVRCGDNVPAELIGKLVFSFSPHSSRLILDRECAHIVPDGISAEDAMFFPSVETALSLVHDANVRIGEKVAIYGQGLIGLLVTSILSLSNIGSGDVGTITVFDMLKDRLACASMMGASAALLPTQAEQAGPFDVSIEISGNGRALQSAIDFTSSGGRIILGSWYGNKDITLKLGIDFHRSHKTIITSQVSEIPAALTGLWNKERRFNLTWELLRIILPSRLISKTVTLDEAQVAYESLDRGDEIAVSFKY